MSGLPPGKQSSPSMSLQSVESRAEDAFSSGTQTPNTHSEEQRAESSRPSSFSHSHHSDWFPLFPRGAQGQRDQQCHPKGGFLHVEARIPQCSLCARACAKDSTSMIPSATTMLWSKCSFTNLELRLHGGSFPKITQLESTWIKSILQSAWSQILCSQQSTVKSQTFYI